MQKVARNEICGGRSCGATLWKALIQPIHYHSPQAENYHSAVSLAEIMFVNTRQLSRISRLWLLRLLKDIDLTHL